MLYSVFFSPWYSTTFCILGNLFIFLCSFLKINSMRQKVHFALFTVVSQQMKHLFYIVCARMLNHFSRVQLQVTLWTVGLQAPLSMGFLRQEQWSGLHALLQGTFLTQGSNPHLLCLLRWQVLLFVCFVLFVTSATWKALYSVYSI